MLLIKQKLVRSIHQNKTCSNIDRNSSAADNHVVFFAAAVKLPCGFEQFEEFADGSLMLRIRSNGNHIRSVITALRPPPGYSAHVWTIARPFGFLPRCKRSRLWSRCRIPDLLR